MREDNDMAKNIDIVNSMGCVIDKVAMYAGYMNSSLYPDELTITKYADASNLLDSFIPLLYGEEISIRMAHYIIKGYCACKSLPYPEAMTNATSMLDPADVKDYFNANESSF